MSASATSFSTLIEDTKEKLNEMHELDDATEVDVNAAVDTLKSMSKEVLTAIEEWLQGEGSV